jgi:hypothetical protein
MPAHAAILHPPAHVKVAGYQANPNPVQHNKSQERRQVDLWTAAQQYTQTTQGTYSRKHDELYVF